MSTRDLLDPELHPLVDGVPELQLSVDMLPKFRAARAKEIVLGDTERAQVSREEVFVPNESGPDVRCLLYVPREQSSHRPAYLHIHGGGYVMGSPEGSDSMNLIIASKLGAVILSVGYRLAPEHPIPAPLDDCYAALAWLHENASTWQVDRQRIAVGGESAGGGLAAALAIQARDRGQYAVCHQHLTYPMLDNLTGSAAQPGDPLVGEFVWTRASNLFGWTCFLGGAAAEAPQVPARVSDYAGLPPT
ncbi:MAG: alpha/beta hydrolase fold domain-containing protein, partial [Pseudomonadales bacterium]